MQQTGFRATGLGLARPTAADGNMPVLKQAGRECCPVHGIAD